MSTHHLSHSSNFVELRRRQCSAWERGERLYVESLIDGDRHTLSDGELLELLSAEMELRRVQGDECHFDEYQRRFPLFADRLFAGQGTSDTPSHHNTRESLPAQEESGSPPRMFDALETLPEEPSSVPLEYVGGTRFGDYELLEEIARGGMGIVYRAKQLSLSRIVALKTILAGKLASKAEVRRFKIEAEAAAQLDHPGIVPIFEIGEHDGQNFYSMAYIDGIDLAERVSRGPLEPHAAAKLVFELAEAVQYAHDRGILHRDLKPRNILLDSHGRPKITDFGLARRIDADGGLTKTGEFMGTPHYMAPEQVSGSHRELGPSVDIYALGGILYCLLTGSAPFKGQSSLQILIQVLEKEPVPPREINRDIPLDLERICIRALRKSPADRYLTARDLCLDLEKFLRNETVEIHDVVRFSSHRGWFRRGARALGLGTFSSIGSTGIKYDELRQAAYATDPAVLFVGPRVMDRVIQSRRASQTLTLRVPHAGCFCIERQELFKHVEEEDLLLEPERSIPSPVILLARPTSRQLDLWGRSAALTRYWRLIFHARIHLALDEMASQHQAMLTDFIRQVGPTAFAEIRSVLEQEGFLDFGATDREVYVEFAAVFLDLWHFRRNLLPTFFPALQGLEKIRAEFQQHFNVESLLLKSRLPGAPEPSMRKDLYSDEVHADFWALSKRAEQISKTGDLVQGAILYMKAARIAPAEQTETTLVRARLNVQRLLERLKSALHLPDEEVHSWQHSLPTLLDKAEGGVSSKEAKCLFDLQRVCIEHERKPFTLDLVEWITTAGARPIKRSLGSLRMVRPMRALRSAMKSLTVVRVPAESRTELNRLMETALGRCGERLRERFRTELFNAFNDMGVTPQDLPERIALQKLIEELLDKLTQEGVISFLEVRDAIARSQIKLADLPDPQAFWRGNALLRLDRRLYVLMEGVYQPGSVYLRWIERFGSVGFGTEAGRWLCRNVIVPFGGANLALRVGDEMIEMSKKYFAHSSTAETNKAFESILHPNWNCWILGAVILLLMHSSRLRGFLSHVGTFLASKTYQICW